MQAEHPLTGGFIISPLCAPEVIKNSPKPVKTRKFTIPVGIFSDIRAEFLKHSRTLTKKAIKSAISAAVAVYAVVGFCSFFTIGTAIYCGDKPIAYASGEEGYLNALSFAQNYAESFGENLNDFQIHPAVILRSKVARTDALSTKLLLASSFSGGCTLYSGNTPVFVAENEAVAREVMSSYVADYSMNGRVSPINDISYRKTVIPTKNISGRDECRAILERANIKVISTVNTSSEKVIPFETETKNDPALYIGDSVTEQEGSNGEMLLTNEVVYENGALKSTKVVSESVTSAPVSRVVRIGTKPKDILVQGVYAPLQGQISSEFGERWGKNHEGLDIAVPVGTPVKSAEGGTVLFCGDAGTYGKLVKIDHGNGIVTAYAHLSEITVTQGQIVGANTQIALSGNTGRSTGPHLHFEIVKDGVPLNPKPYIKKR